MAQHVLGDHFGGETFELGPNSWLQAIHTPGHASNHLCFLLPQERLLFTGDHVMQGSTVVINPPDGDMAAYFSALRGVQTKRSGYVSLFRSPETTPRLVELTLGTLAEVTSV